MRPVTGAVQEIEDGQWAIGSNPLTASAVKAMAATKWRWLNLTSGPAPRPAGGMGQERSRHSKTDAAAVDIRACDAKGRRQVHEIQWTSSFSLGSLSKLAQLAARAL
jgi:hypothetical protein